MKEFPFTHCLLVVYALLCLAYVTRGTAIFKPTKKESDEQNG